MSFLDMTEEQLGQLPSEALSFLQWQLKWTQTARPNQIPPEVDPETGKPWLECGYQAGRGFGKTRVGAEWLGRAIYEDPSGFASAVICPTFADVKFTAFEGQSGLLSVVPPDLILDYNKSDLVIVMRNIGGGSSLIRGFSAEKPERLRGPEHCRGWLDELAAWLLGEDTWNMYQFGLRLGKNPQTLWTSTPKPKEIVRKLVAPKPGRIIVRGSTDDNVANLPESFYDQISQHRGTSLGRQEIAGELIDPEEAGIVKRSQFRVWPHDKPLPAFSLIVMSMDTAYTEKTLDRKSGDPDPTACGVFGVFQHEKRANVMLLDCWEDHLGLPALIRRTRKELNSSYGDDTEPVISPLVGPGRAAGHGRKPDIFLLEDKGSGISLRQMLEAEGIIAYPYNPGRADKLTRLHIVSPVFARRLVWLPESSNAERKGKPANWTEAMIAQLCSFTGPGSIKHDDYVDVVTQALRLMVDQRLLDTTVPQRELKARAEEEEVRRQGRGPRSNPYSL